MIHEYKEVRDPQHCWFSQRSVPVYRGAPSRTVNLYGEMDIRVKLVLGSNEKSTLVLTGLCASLYESLHRN